MRAFTCRAFVVLIGLSVVVGAVGCGSKKTTNPGGATSGGTAPPSKALGAGVTTTIQKLGGTGCTIVENPTPEHHTDCPNATSYQLLPHKNLSFANLPHANLSLAPFSHANFSHTNLSYAKLTGADLDSANLTSANLSHADLATEEFGDIVFRTIAERTFVRTCGQRASTVAATPALTFYPCPGRVIAQSLGVPTPRPQRGQRFRQQ